MRHEAVWFALLYSGDQRSRRALAIVGAEVGNQCVRTAPIKDATIVIAEGGIVSITSGAPPPASARALGR